MLPAILCERCGDGWFATLSVQATSPFHMYQICIRTNNNLVTWLLIASESRKKAHAPQPKHSAVDLIAEFWLCLVWDLLQRATGLH